MRQYKRLILLLVFLLSLIAFFLLASFLCGTEIFQHWFDLIDKSPFFGDDLTKFSISPVSPVGVFVCLDKEGTMKKEAKILKEWTAYIVVVFGFIFAFGGIGGAAEAKSLAGFFEGMIFFIIGTLAIYGGAKYLGYWEGSKTRR